MGSRTFSRRHQSSRVCWRFDFTSIAAVVVGGASMLGGSGSYAGTFFGALALTLLSAVLPLLDLDTAELDIAYGVVIVLAGASALTAGGRWWRRGGGR